MAHSLARPAATAVAEINEEGVVVKSCSFSALERRVAAQAERICAATEPGDSVVSVMTSGIDSVVNFLAAIAAGVRWVPLDARAAAAEVRSAAVRSGAKCAIVVHAPGSEAALAGVCRLLPQSETECDQGGQQTADSVRALARREGMLVRGSAGAIVLSSSGTTAVPKLVLRESPALDADAAAVIAGLWLTDNDCVLATTPLSHSYGVDMLLGAIMAGAALHVMARFAPLAIAEQMQAGATVLPGVPFTFEALARIAPSNAVTVRVAVSAGAPLPERVREEFTGAWGIEVGNLYGATELGTVAVCVVAGRRTGGYRPGFAGGPLGAAKFRIVDPANTAVCLAAGEEGHLAVRAPSMLGGYVGEVAPLVDGYFLTGDLARLDSDGGLTITGRLKNLIDLGTAKVNPAEIEAEICAHPGVAECVVMAVAASNTLNRLAALVVRRAGDESATAESLREFLRARLSASKIPRSIRIVESLPKSPTGKLLRAQC